MVKSDKERVCAASRILVLAAAIGAASMTACQVQPLYQTPSVAGIATEAALATVTVADVTTRDAQQVRNELIFLLSGGSTPLSPEYEVRLRISTSVRNLAGRISDRTTAQLGNTAGSVRIAASYEIYDLSESAVIHRGRRTARASFDKTSQSFASERAQRDAVNRAAKAVAEQLRHAIAADLSAS